MNKIYEEQLTIRSCRCSTLQCRILGPGDGLEETEGSESYDVL